MISYNRREYAKTQRKKKTFFLNKVHVFLSMTNNLYTRCEYVKGINTDGIDRWTDKVNYRLALLLKINHDILPLVIFLERFSKLL